MSARPWSKTQRLTERQRRFVDEYLVDGNATAAAVRAGYANNRGTKAEASKTMNLPHIAAEIKRRQDERSARYDITLDSLTKMTMDAYETAKARDEPASMVAAVRQLSKMHGFEVGERGNERPALSIEILKGKINGVVKPNGKANGSNGADHHDTV